MKAALLIVDVQRGFFEADPRPFEADAVLARINQLSARARTANAPVIFLQHDSTVDQLEHGTAPWELHGSLSRTPTDHVLRKTTPDGFLRPSLLDLLEEQGIRRVVICGYATEFCINTTTRRAAAQGFAVTIVGDAHTTHDAAHARADTIRTHHNATLPGLTSFGPEITVVTTDDVVF